MLLLPSELYVSALSVSEGVDQNVIKSLSCSFFDPQSMTLNEAEEKLLVILKQVMEEKLTSTNVEVFMTMYLHASTQHCCHLFSSFQLNHILGI